MMNSHVFISKFQQLSTRGSLVHLQAHTLLLSWVIFQ